MKRIFMFILPALLCLTASSFGASLANPAAQIPDARLAVGASYFLGGSTITNMEIPMMMNRIGARVSYAPIRYVNFGFDFGTAQISVDQYTVGSDTIPIFDGGFGWSVGGHLKLSSPFLLEYVALFGLANGNFFRSTNKQNAYYGGKEGVGVIGAQVRIPNVGYVSIGPQIHLILGDNRDKDKADGDAGKKGSYSNINNVRGWIAFDYFPEMDGFTGNQKPYVSVEFTASPKIGGSARVPIQEFSVAISIGAITQRLYGFDREAEEF